MKSLLFISLSLLLFGCGTGRLVRIETNPPGANVILADKVIGVTPLDISEQSFNEEFKESYLTLTLSKPEFEDRLVTVPTTGLQNFKIDLKSLDQKYFESVLLKHFQRPQNQLVRELLQIQGLLFAQKNAEAETRLQTFTKSYPNIAATYVLQANLAIAKGDPKQAKLFLQRALSLDPQDAVAQRMLANFIGGKSQ